MTSPADRNERFYEWLRQEIEVGFTAGPDICAYLETTFGHCDLPRILATAESADIDSLFDLIFFPDEALCIRFETQWGEAGFSQKELDSLIARFARHPLQSVIRMGSAEAPPLRIMLPPFAAAALLLRLNAAWQPAPSLQRIVREICPADRRVAVRLYLRRARLDWHPDQLEGLDRYLAGMPAGADDFVSLLAYLLSVLAEMPAGQPVEAFFTATKGAYYQLLGKAEAFERRRQGANMEILMLQGERAIHGTPQHWRGRLDLLDRLSQVVLGRIIPIHDPLEHPIDLGHADAGDLETLVKLLR